MNWFSIILDIAVAIYGHFSGKTTSNLKHELELAKGMVKTATKDMSPTEKGRLMEEAANEFIAVKKFKKRVSKKITKAKIRLYKKIF